MESKEEKINVPKKVIEGMQTNTPSTPKLPTTPPSSSYNIPWSSICFTLIFLLLVGGGAYYYFVIMKKDTSVIDNALTPEYAPVQAVQVPVQTVIETNE